MGFAIKGIPLTNSSRRFVVKCMRKWLLFMVNCFYHPCFLEQMVQSVCGNCESPFSKVSNPKMQWKWGKYPYSPLSVIEADHLDLASRRATYIITMKKRYFVLLLIKSVCMLAATRETRNLIGLWQRPSNNRYKHERENGVWTLYFLAVCTSKYWFAL